MITVLAKIPSECAAGMSGSQRLSQHAGEQRTDRGGRNPDHHEWTLKNRCGRNQRSRRRRRFSPWLRRFFLLETAGRTGLTRHPDLIRAMRQEILLEFGVE